MTIPDGFTLMPIPSEFVALVGPYYYKPLPEGGFVYGVQTDERHNNTNGVLHGAVYVALADTFLGHALLHGLQRKCATISLNSSFIAGAAPGAWLEGRPTIVRATRSVAYLNAEVHADGVLVYTASAVFKLFRTEMKV